MAQNLEIFKASESKLIIVSNRLPVSISPAKNEKGYDLKASAGGLVSGLKALHAQDNALWIGHSGLFGENKELAKELAEKRFLSVPIKEKEYKRYYEGLSNNTIWPLCHYFTQTFRFSHKDWESYKTVNKKFTDKVLEIAGPDDKVWIQDYQLMLVPEMLRKSNSKLNVAYFHHIPFPSSEVFRMLPVRKDLLQGILGASLIGFHTFDYARHFLASCSKLVGRDIQIDEIQSEKGIVKVGVFPLGIDTELAKKHSKEIAEKPSKKKDVITLLGIDRLDYSKGILERLKGFQRFLEKNPDYVGKVSLIQLCVPSRSNVRAYVQLKRDLERLVGEISGEFSHAGYHPVQYLYRSLPSEDVYRLYHEADIMLVTPLRDGLNLVCKEFVSTKAEGNGVLILSEFAGSAAEMGEAILVNPYDTNQISSAIYDAVTMDEKDKKRRMRALHERTMEYGSRRWASNFLAYWEKIQYSKRRSVTLNKKKIKSLKEKFQKANKLHLFFDFDGTLAPIVTVPEAAAMSEETFAFLRKLSHNENSIVSLVTGRPREFLSEKILALPMNFACEHGMFTKSMKSGDWRSQGVSDLLSQVKPEILFLLELHTRSVPNSFVEEKEFSICWHYRNSPEEFAENQARLLKEELRQLLSDTAFTVYTGKKILEIRPVLASKGYAVESFTSDAAFDDKSDLILTFGDDVTDEDMYEMRPEVNYSFHIGKGPTYASYKIEQQKDLLAILKEMIPERFFKD